MPISFKKLDENKFSWLKKSIFYESLDDSDEDIYLEYCSKYTKDIKKYLRVINLWGIYYFPKEFLVLFYKIKPLKEISKLFDITRDKFYEFLRDSLLSDNICHYTIKMNKIDFLKNLYDCGYEKTNVDCLLALKNLEILKYLVNNGHYYDRELLLELCLFECFEKLKKMKQLF